MTRFDRLHNLFKWNNSIQAKQLETIDDFPQKLSKRKRRKSRKHFTM